MAFSPEGRTVTMPTAVLIPGMRWMCSREIPSCSNSSSATGANRSSPVQAMRLTSAPRRAAPTAWLVPLPPGPRSKRSPISPSPGTGMRGTLTVMPTTKLPRTVIATMGGYCCQQPSV